MENTELLEELKKISLRLDKIENDIYYLKKGTDNMNNHITFIDSVYNSIKSPIYYILNKVHKIDHIPEKKLIEDNKNI